MKLFNIITMTAALSNLTLALPNHQPTGSTGLNSLKSPTNCYGATKFYTCSNNKFNGCCSVDPCALPACPDYHSASPQQIGTYLGRPIAPQDAYVNPYDSRLQTPSYSQDPLATCISGDHKEYHAALYTIFPSSPEVPAFSNSFDNSTISLFRSGDVKTEKQQLVVFPPLPYAAQDCTLGWSQTPFSNATLNGSTLIDVVEVSSLPSAMSHGMVMGMTQGKMGTIRLGGVRGTGDSRIEWNDEQRGCDKLKYFKVGFPEGQLGSVDMEQRQGSGFYIKYHC